MREKYIKKNHKKHFSDQSGRTNVAVKYKIFVAVTQNILSWTFGKINMSATERIFEWS